MNHKHTNPQNKTNTMPPKQERKPQTSTPTGQASEIKPTPQLDAEPEPTERRQRVESHRRCPTCWGNYGGAGKHVWRRQINGPLTLVGYRCDTCGATWQSEVRIEESDDVTYVQKRIVKVDVPPDGQMPSEKNSK